MRGSGIEGRRAGQFSSLCLSVPICIRVEQPGQGRRHGYPPSPTHQLSLLSSGQGEPLPLPAGSPLSSPAASAAEGDRRPRQATSTPPTPDTPSATYVSSRRAQATAPLKPQGWGGGWRPTRCFLSSTQGAFSHGGISCSVLSFCKKRWMWGRERNEACWLLVSGRAQENPEEGGPGSDTQGLGAGLGYLWRGCVWDHGRLLPDYLPSSGSHHHHHSHFL